MTHSVLPGNNGLLLGIGGSGMSSLAHILLDMGFSVFGYDKKVTDVTEHLTERGAKIVQDLDSIDVKLINFVVFSSAINDKNHDLFQEVNKLNIPMFHRSTVMHKVFALKNSISVAGSHGKTSTTAMIAQILEENDFEPSIMIGGDTSLLGKKGGKFGEGDWGVYESDESDGTFLKHTANVRIITNIDNDHLDFYKSIEKLQLAFLEYLAPEKLGYAIVQAQDEGIKKVLQMLVNKEGISKDFRLLAIIPFSEINNHFTMELIQNLTKTFPLNFNYLLYEIKGNQCDFTYFEKSYSLTLPFSGTHYLTNALCALLAALSISIPIEKSLKSLNHYVGVKRRQEVLGVKNGIKVIDDYGHHPTEIKTVILSLKKDIGQNHKLIVLFQPHRYSRTQILQKELASALNDSDFLFLLPIYSAGEEIIPGVTAETIAAHLKISKYKILEGDSKKDQTQLAAICSEGDTLLCIGAGNVREWGENFLQSS